MSFIPASPEPAKDRGQDPSQTLSPEAAPAALDVVAVSHRYGKRQALDNVSFQVRPASFAVLLGLNGAGKSTLFSLITRLYATQSGAIRIYGFDIGRGPSEALRRLGVVFQARTLDLDLSVAQNLAYHAALHGIGAREAMARARTVLEQIDMTDRAKDKVRGLSGGQMRRVEIARALLHRPCMLLLDEPTVGLDMRARADMLAHVRGLVAREGVGVLWATHLIDEVEPGDDVVLLHEGKLLDKGNVGEVAARAGARDIGSAFAKLTEAARRVQSEAE
jgi:ABC-2 type transport system ATP-binding protein